MTRKDESDTTVCDFSRSCLRWRIDVAKKRPVTVSRAMPVTLNNVRVPLECAVRVTDTATGDVAEAVLGASCKTEQVGVASGVWHEPNGDFCVVASTTQCLTIKRWDRADKELMRAPASLGPQPEREMWDVASAYDSFSIDVACRPARELITIDEIIEVLRGDMPVVCHTEYDVGGLRVVVAYPLKTVNFTERERLYQVDTGPVMLPELAGGIDRLVPDARLAYVAHNCPEWAEFLVNVPTPVAEGVRVHHYAETVRIGGTTNRLFVFCEDWATRLEGCRE